MPINIENEMVRCDWVRQNNGVIQTKLVQGRTHGSGTGTDIIIILNTERVDGVPKPGETYFVSVRPAFPREVE